MKGSKLQIKQVNHSPCQPSL